LPRGENTDLKSDNISLPVDLIRTLAIVLVILLHASIEQVPAVVGATSDVLVQWWSVNIYHSLSRVGVPLFVMLSGALLLQSSKVNEPLKVFFRKRASRIALPFLFWGLTYFAWRIFVNHESLTLYSIGQSIIWGPYFHFWFLYMLIGLYLVTPLLRVYVANASWKLQRYALVLWLIGTALVPLIGIFANYYLNNNLFIFTGYAGYFLLGIYLMRVQLRKPLLLTLFLIGVVWTAVGTYLITATTGGSQQYFFYDNLSAGVILASASLFLLLGTVQYDKIQKRFTRISGLLHFISKNSLGIYLFHFIVLETLQKGYLGVQISLATMNPIIEIPLLTIVTLILCILVLYPLKKIPLVNRLIG
jgi:surface polysaccharide O-acyltransferase-like enzyme